jgi:hypothetical protein
MSNIARLLGLAQKALDKAASTQEVAGRIPTPRPDAAAAGGGAPAASVGSAADRAAIARYDYLLQTADPHQVEQVHREAFARLTPAQRAQIDERMRAELPEHEQPRSSRPDDLARAAARTEAARPGLLRGLLARAGGGAGPGGVSAGSAAAGPGTRGLRDGRGAGMAGGAAAGAGLAAGGALAAVAGGAVLSGAAAPLLEQAAALGVDFDALAGAVGLEGIAGGAEGLTTGVDELAAGAGDTVSGVGDQLTGLGDQVREFGSRLGIPGLDDLFGR